jgi:cytochrome bd-type quinol oxidase subunit 2
MYIIIDFETKKVYTIEKKETIYMDKNRILEVATKENNDEFIKKKYERAQVFGKSAILGVLAIIGFIESFRYENAVWMMIIPAIAMILTDSLIKVIYKKDGKSSVVLFCFEIAAFIFVVISYIIKTWI